MTFLKWVGGKSQLLPELNELFPNASDIKGYIEPFLGGGSVFFYLMEMESFRDSLNKKNIYLSDINPELINCYKAVRDNIDILLPLLQVHQREHCEDYYYKIRDSYFSRSDIERAATFIYLNKTCFNGIWRVNKDGMPNVPIGHKEKIDIYDRRTIGRSSQLLQYANINVMSFENILNIKNIEGYLVYMDPPYYIVDKKGMFTGYTSDSFTKKRTLMLEVFKNLDKLGCKVMLSNSCSPTINIFKDFNIKILKAKRMINSDGDNRGSVDEAIVLNYFTKDKQRKIDDSWL